MIFSYVFGVEFTNEELLTSGHPSVRHLASCPVPCGFAAHHEIREEALRAIRAEGGYRCCL